jgi:aryl-phospho-beta-D-glucosidase BglC (GH1 family)
VSPKANLALGRGINLGGWLNGPVQNDEHRRSFVTQKDFCRIAEWGLSNIRLPFDYALIHGEQPGEIKEKGLAWIDLALDWAQESNLKVILDMHRLPGYSFIDGAEKPGQVPPLFTDPAQQEFFFELWRLLSQRYLNRHENLVFELANEIAAPTGARWNELAAETVRAIREIDATRPLVVGSNCWNVCSTYTDMAIIDDPNIIYNFHFYNPFPFTHQKASWAPELMFYNQTIRYPGKSQGLYAAAQRARCEGKEHLVPGLRSLGDFFEERRSDKQHLVELMQPALDFAHKHKVPLYCGEFGVIKNAPREDAFRWYRDILEIFAENDIAWSLWSYQDAHFPLVDDQGVPCNENLPELLASTGHDTGN